MMNRDELTRLARQLQALAPPPGVWKAAAEAAASLRAFTLPEGLWKVLEEAQLWAEFVEEKQQEERLLAPFVENGLCIAPSMPKDFVKECVRRYEASQHVLKYVLTHYRRNRWRMLGEMVDSWQDHHFIAPRMHRIEEALWAHRRRRYAASVALLIHEPEGIVLDWATADSAVKAVRAKDKERRKRRSRSGQDSNGQEDLSRWDVHIVTTVVGMLAASSLTKYQWTCMESLIRFCVRHIYQPYLSFDQHAEFFESDRLSRHALAHGSSLRSGTPENSLRLFLALDVLALVKE